jgi:hypothetical protein
VGIDVMYDLFAFFDSPQAKSVLAAVSGGIISKRFKPTMTRGMWIGSIAAGAVMARFIAMPLADWFGDENLAGVTGLFVGLFGLVICDTIEDTIRTTPWADIIKKRLGGE